MKLNPDWRFDHARTWCDLEGGEVKLTNIEWTDFSTNPLKYRDNNTGQVVWACAKVSAGCAHCYAESLAERFDRGGPFTKQRLQTVTPFVDTDELRKILTAKTIGGKAVAESKCFLGDMTDIFGDWVPDSMLDQLFAAMALRADVTFQVLTKRPERMAEYLKGSRTGVRIGASLMDLARGHLAAEIAVIGIAHKLSTGIGLPNVHLGTSVENQQAADERIPHLLRVPAAVRFLSCEPLLGPVSLDLPRCEIHDREFVQQSDDFGEICSECAADGFIGEMPHNVWLNPCASEKRPGINWVIVGGESGPSARPMNPSWVRDLRDQCLALDIPFFFKQWGEWAPGNVGPGGDLYARDRTKIKSGMFDYSGVWNPGGPNPFRQTMDCVGKKSAGRLLDGREWNEFPTVGAIS